MHGVKGGMVNCQDEMKRAVDAGYWNMFRYNPAAKAKYARLLKMGKLYAEDEE